VGTSGATTEAAEGEEATERPVGITAIEVGTITSTTKGTITTAMTVRVAQIRER
jgi:hypothetical protein